MRRILPKEGARRIKRKFLWWTKTIGNECRWFETTSWEEVFVTWRSLWTMGKICGKWIAKYWIKEGFEWNEDTEEEK